MQTLDLDCPSCGENLELDAGFAGGVCRCSNCGTLMTVPRDAGRAEQLTAPQRPGSASEGSFGSTMRDVAPRSRTSKQTSRGKKSGKRGRSGKTTKQATESTIQAGEYRTNSGRVVTVETPTRVPMAQSRRKQIRIATTIVFAGVILGIALIAGVGLWIFASGNGGSSSGDQTGTDTPPPSYNAQANPYTLKFANIAGIPLDGDVAIVVEATQGDSAFWLPQAGDMILMGLRQKNANAKASFFAATKGAPIVFDDGDATAIHQIDEDKLESWFNEMAYKREVDRLTAIERALKNKPDTLILVFSGAKDADIKAWDKVIAKQKGLTVHAVFIDSSAHLPMQAWLRDREASHGITLSSGKIKDWKETAGD